MKKIKIILLKDVSILGVKGDITEVTFGYFKNYLLPQKLAEVLTEAKLQQIEAQKIALAQKEKKDFERAKKLKKLLKSITLKFKMPAEKEHLYGSIGPKDIVKALAEKNIKISEKNILMDSHIKTTGEHSVSIDLGYNFKTKLQIKIQASFSKKSSKNKK